MIRTHRGRGGWEADSWGALLRTAALAVVIVALACAGCSSQKKQGEGAGGAGGPGQGGIGEGGMGPGGGSSLTGLQKGTLGKNGQQGPLSDIHFDYNDYTVRPQDSEILRGNADWLQKNNNNRVQIEGHCDERGSEEYNIALGAKRAQAAKDYLQTLGVAADRMSTISYGKELPLCTEHTEDCWEQNRRDHFVVTE
jgi:peptidoglycan-associated lipoprotein